MSLSRVHHTGVLDAVTVMALHIRTITLLSALLAECSARYCKHLNTRVYTNCWYTGQELSISVRHCFINDALGHALDC